MITMIPRSKLEPHPDNPRKDLGDLTELAASIKKQGLLQNLTVIKSPAFPDKYRILIGHRRFAAAEIAGLDELPCTVEEMDHASQIAIMLSENMQRNDLTICEQVGGIQTMMDLGVPVKEIADKTGLSSTTIRSRAKLTEVNQELLHKAEQKGATLYQLAEISRIEDIKLREEVLADVGTANYNWHLNQAKEIQRVSKHMPAVRTALDAFATEINGSAYEYGRTTHMQLSYVRTIEIPPDNGNALKRPSDVPDDAEFVYLFNGRNVTLYLIGETAVDQEASERKKRDARRDECKNAESAVADAARKLRDDFMYAYNGREADKSGAYAFVTFILLHGGYMRPMDMPLLRKHIPSKGTGKRVTPEDLEACKSSPVRAMVIAAYEKWKDQGGSEFDHCMHWDGKYFENADLVQLYDHMKLLGYEVSDEEESWLNGSHSCYENAYEEEESDDAGES